jgi:hypothetical protein
MPVEDGIDTFLEKEVLKSRGSSRSKVSCYGLQVDSWESQESV